MPVTQEDLLTYLAAAIAFKESLTFVQGEYRRLYTAVLDGTVDPLKAFEELGYSASSEPPREHYEFIAKKQEHFKYRAARNTRERIRNERKRRMAGVPTFNDYRAHATGLLSASQLSERVDANMAEAFHEHEARAVITATRSTLAPGPASSRKASPAVPDYALSEAKEKAIMDEVIRDIAQEGLSPYQIAQNAIASALPASAETPTEIIDGKTFRWDNVRKVHVEIMDSDPLKHMVEGESLFGEASPEDQPH